MTHRRITLLPARISVQIAVLITVAIASVHVILTAIFLLRSSDGRAELPPNHPEQIEVIATILDVTSSEDRDRLLDAASKQYPDLALRLDRSKTADWAAPRASLTFGWFGRNLPPGLHVSQAREDEGGRRIAIRLRDGDIVTAQMPEPPSRWRVFNPIIITILSIGIITIMLAAWAAQAVTAPLRAFARAAESFSPRDPINPLPERGPEEVRVAARALNRMRERIKSLVDDRTRMLMAVGHDLRTPITRLRLASEFVGEAQLQRQMVRDLDQMNAMVESAIVFLREGRSAKRAVDIDVLALLQTICEEFADAGHDVRLAESEHANSKAEPDDLRRALVNLIDNAVRHAGGAVIRVSRGEGSVNITVDDEGSGIPDDAKVAMLQPFARGEPARHMDASTGFGLGLSIASAIVTAHGGTCTLHDRLPIGLRVRIALPEIAAPLKPAAAG
jgi:signal transduction histidine kinase